jgi:hypothetical protein
MGALTERPEAAAVWDKLSRDQQDLYLAWIGKEKAERHQMQRMQEVLRLLPCLPAMQQFGSGVVPSLHGFPAMP